MNSETLVNDDDTEEMDESILEGIPDFIREKLLDMKNKIDNLESLFAQIDSQPIKELQSKLSPLELAKFNWISIYSINSLYFVYLKNNGVAMKDHPIMSEFNRIKNYMTRINEISEKYDGSSKNKFRIDKESSARIIKRSLWANASNKKGGRSQINQMVNSTLENGTGAVDNDNGNEENESNKRELESEEDNLEKNPEDHVEKKVKR